MMLRRIGQLAVVQRANKKAFFVFGSTKSGTERERKRSGQPTKGMGGKTEKGREGCRPIWKSEYCILHRSPSFIAWFVLKVVFWFWLYSRFGGRSDHFLLLLWVGSLLPIKQRAAK